MTVALLTLSLTFFAPSTRLQSGQTVSLHGTGPPVLFSSGLFGLMPRRIYTRLFEELTKNVTMVVLNDAAPVTAAVVRDVADTLAVDRLGFFSHSSMDVDILRSDRIGKAVLCDPVVMPSVTFEEGLSSSVVDADCPVLVWKAEKTYDPSFTPIPDFLMPRFSAHDPIVRIFSDVGHADLLDDPWAELGQRSIPWMNGATSRMASFREWTFERNRNEANLLRSDYRKRVASSALAHLLSEPSADGMVIDVEESPPQIVAELE